MTFQQMLADMCYRIRAVLTVQNLSDMQRVVGPGRKREALGLIGESGHDWGLGEGLAMVGMYQRICKLGHFYLGLGLLYRLKLKKLAAPKFGQQLFTQFWSVSKILANSNMMECRRLG